jgi:hypothetical protein
MIDLKSVKTSGSLEETSVIEVPDTQEPPVSFIADVVWVVPTFGTLGVVEAWVGESEWDEYDEMDEDEEDEALRIMSMSSLQSELDDEPDFDAEL